MDRAEAKKTIEAMRQVIRQHDYLYYVQAQPEITDNEYDKLMKQLEALESKFTDLITSDSPTQRVGGTVEGGFPTVKHRTPMLSLDNTFNENEVLEWDDRLQKILGDTPHDYVAEPKIDGVSLSLIYENGKLVRGVTRGDGENGEDITANVRTISSIPLRLRAPFPKFFDVRGEVFMMKKDFAKMNSDAEKRGDETFANPRNAAAGSLRQKNPAIAAQRPLRFLTHSFGAAEGIVWATHYEFLKAAAAMGLPIPASVRRCETVMECMRHCRMLERERNDLDYDIDGAVLKLNSFELRAKAGFTAKSPRWAVAFKFAAQQGTSEVLDIKVSVGRTGTITPVAKLKPVSVGGVTISNASLHNFDEIKRLGIKIGDKVVVQRAGDVIPQISKVIESQRTGKEKAFVIPETCPVCDAPIAKEKEVEVAYRCTNPGCPAQISRGLIHYASRDAMDIEGLGEVAVQQLVERKLVKDIADIYSLTRKDLMGLELFADKRAENLLKAIERSKTRPLSRVVYGLGIRHVGEKAAFVLAQKFLSLDALAEATVADLQAINEVGPVVAESIVTYFKLPTTQTLRRKLKRGGLTLKEEPIATARGALLGKTVVFTGELKALSRSQAERLVREQGGSPTDSVSKNTDFVVVGKEPGSKYAKAQKLGVKTLTEREFLSKYSDKKN